MRNLIPQLAEFNTKIVNTPDDSITFMWQRQCMANFGNIYSKPKILFNNTWAGTVMGTATTPYSYNIQIPIFYSNFKIFVSWVPYYAADEMFNLRYGTNGSYIGNINHEGTSILNTFYDGTVTPKSDTNSFNNGTYFHIDSWVYLPNQPTYGSISTLNVSAWGWNQ